MIDLSPQLHPFTDFSGGKYLCYKTVLIKTWPCWLIGFWVYFITVSQLLSFSSWVYFLPAASVFLCKKPDDWIQSQNRGQENIIIASWRHYSWKEWSLTLLLCRESWRQWSAVRATYPDDHFTHLLKIFPLYQPSNPSLLCGSEWSCGGTESLGKGVIKANYGTAEERVEEHIYLPHKWAEAGRAELAASLLPCHTTSHKDTPPGRWGGVKCMCIPQHYSYRQMGSLFHWALGIEAL